MSLSVPSLKVLEMLPSVPLDLAMRVLQSVVKKGAFYLLDPPAILTRKIVSRVLNLDPRQQVIYVVSFHSVEIYFVESLHQRLYNLNIYNLSGMADLSQLGAAAEDLNEETLQEEESFALSSVWMKFTIFYSFLFRSSAEMRRLQLLTRRTMRSWQRLDLLPRLGLSPISSLTIWKTTWLEGDTIYGGEYIF